MVFRSWHHFQLIAKKTMPWASENGFIYDVLPKVCDTAKVYDIDETREGSVRGNMVYIPKSSRKKPKITTT